MPTRSTFGTPTGVLWLLALLALCYVASTSYAQDDAARLIDQQPFDRVTLKQAAGGDVIDTLLLDLPNRQVPSPLPTAGELNLRRVVEPSVLYTAPWASVAKIELFEQLILNEAQQQIDASKFAEAYESLEFLNEHYPQLNHLAVTTEKYLKRDAFHSFSEKQYLDALSILTALYDYNPKHRGLASAIDVVLDRMMAAHLAARDFSAARSVIDSTPTTFPELELKSIAVWQKKFEEGAKRQLLLAQRHLEKKEYHEARQSLRRAIAILPSLPKAKKMLDDLYRLSPQIMVGVTQLGTATASFPLADMAALRIFRLTEPQFVELVDFGSEGGIYSSPWADFSVDDTGLDFSIQLNDHARKVGMQASALAMQFLNAAVTSDQNAQPLLAGLLKDVAIENGKSVHLHWWHPHVRPDALLQLSVKKILAGSSPPSSYRPVSDDADENLLRFDYQNQSDNQEKPPSILERVFSSEEMALAALLRGDVDVLDRVAPWQIDRLRSSKQITVSDYRLPTVHVLLPNYSKPLQRRREFRRALCYGINRQQIVKEILLAGKTHPGFRVLSGPLPAGSSISDPLGYGYKQEIKPRTYEPRLAAVLATVARTSLRKNDKTEESGAKADENTSKPELESEKKSPEVKPLILVYPPNPVAQTACLAIKRQLDAVGIPIKLQPISSHTTETAADYDLQYTELAIWEPLTDMQRLLGPKGIVGRCSPAMSLALDAVNQARNWQEARTRLRDLHDVAFYDLPVVPLWQTMNSFAYRNTIQGIGNSPIALYQDVTHWIISSNGAGR